MTRTSLSSLSFGSVLSMIGFGAIALAPTVAHADDLAACVKASESAQSLRDEGKYHKAREQLLICSRDTCPNVVRKDCTQALTEVEESTPSVVVSATDNGHDVIDVKVTVDGAVVASKLEGKPIQLDPGAHTLHYEHAGQPPVDDQIVVRAGEKNRLLKVVFGNPNLAPVNLGGQGSGGGQVPAPPPDVARDPSPISYVLGGVGVVGIGAWIGFGVAGKSSVDNMRATCEGFCSDSAVSHAKTDLLIADIGMGVGIAGLVSGAIVFVATRHTVETADTGAAASLWKHFDVKSAPGGGSMGTFGGTF